MFSLTCARAGDTVPHGPLVRAGQAGNGTCLDDYDSTCIAGYVVALLIAIPLVIGGVVAAIWFINKKRNQEAPAPPSEDPVKVDVEWVDNDEEEPEAT